MKDDARFGLWSDETWILDCYDALQGCQFNYPAVFGVPYIDLPTAIVDDIRALTKRKLQLDKAQRDADAAAKNNGSGRR